MSQLNKIITQDYSKIRDNVIAKLPIIPESDFLESNSIKIENHFFYPALGANGFPNTANFIDLMEGGIRRFSLSARELERHKKLTLEGNDIEAERISQQGRRRFVKYAAEFAKNSGEIGELALFIILEAFFNAPKIASKMRLKTSNDMHVHGSDAIHAVLGDDDTLNLILGESKFRNKRTVALNDAISSVNGFLSSYLKVGKEIELIEGNIDHEILDPNLKNKLLEYFGNFTPQSNQTIKTIAILLGYDKATLYKELSDISCVIARKDELEKRYRDHAKKTISEFSNELIAQNNPKFKEVRFLYALMPFTDLNSLKNDFYEMAGLLK